MSHAPLPCQVSPAALAALQDAARERAVRLRDEAIGAAAAWLARAVDGAARRLTRRVRHRQQRETVWID